MLTAIFVFWSAERRAAAVSRRLQTHKIVEMRSINLKLMSIIMILAAVALIVAIWLLRIGPA